MLPASGFEAVRRGIRERTGLVLPDDLIAEVLSSEPDLADSVRRTGELDADDRARFMMALLPRLDGPGLYEPPEDVVAEVREAGARAGLTVEPPAGCDVSVRSVPGRPDAAIVELSGVLSRSNVDAVLALVEPATRHASIVILDLRGVASADGAILAPLSHISELVEETGALLVVASPPLAAICRAMGEGLALLLPPVYDDVQAAVEGL
jgi:anti-anti-sigma regulatory factor